MQISILAANVSAIYDACIKFMCTHMLAHHMLLSTLTALQEDILYIMVYCYNMIQDDGNMWSLIIRGLGTE